MAELVGRDTEVPGEGGLLSELVELGGQSWRQLLVQQKLCPARQMLATQGQAASYAAATQRTPQEPAEVLACREGPSLWLEDGLGCQCPHQVRRCSCQWAALPPHSLGGTRHREALTVPVPHGIVS